MLGEWNLIYCDCCEVLPETYYTIFCNSVEQPEHVGWWEVCAACHASASEWLTPDKGIPTGKVKRSTNRRITDAYVTCYFAGLIRQYRKARGLSQAALAKRAGMLQNTVARAESGKWLPTARVIRKLAKGLNVVFVCDFVPLDTTDDERTHISAEG